MIGKNDLYQVTYVQLFYIMKKVLIFEYVKLPLISSEVECTGLTLVKCPEIATQTNRPPPPRRVAYKIIFESKW